jgi:hypothetical protein
LDQRLFSTFVRTEGDALINTVSIDPTAPRGSEFAGSAPPPISKKTLRRRYTRLRYMLRLGYLKERLKLICELGGSIA